MYLALSFLGVKYFCLFDSTFVIKRRSLTNLLFLFVSFFLQNIMAEPSNGAVLEIVLKHPDARMPLGQPGSVGYDIASCGPVTISGLNWAVVNTGVQLVIPEGHVGTICSRSGLAATHGITVQAGIIDPNYRGEVKVNKVAYVCVTD